MLLSAKDSGFLACDTVSLGYGFLTFRSNTVPSSSRVEESKTNSKRGRQVHIYIYICVCVCVCVCVSVGLAVERFGNNGESIGGCAVHPVWREGNHIEPMRKFLGGT